MSKKEKLSEKLAYKRKCFWKVASDHDKKEAFDLSDHYKEFLTESKTVRETIKYATGMLKKNGFDELSDDSKKPSRKLFSVYRKKVLICAVLGEKPVSEGVNVVASHIDAPRIDLKQSPLYEDSSTKLALMRTHYYGGIKKYQWMSMPLALHGVVVKADGEVVDVCIGEDENDPVFAMPDLLPHLAQKVQSDKKIGEAINASHMNVIFNTIPYMGDEEKEAVKLNALNLLYEKYGIVERDFLSAELELVPAGKVRDSGLDKSMILGYGQDDRVCAFTSLRAFLDAVNETEKLAKTAVLYFVDKEEVGSEGNTSAKSISFLDFMSNLLKNNSESNDSNTLRRTLIKSQVISADVSPAINPNFPSVHEKENATHFGYGITITKYTGARGKAAGNDSNAEYSAKIAGLFENNEVNWQIGLLGKVDEGGGGTIAKILAEYGPEIIDCGPGILGMHAPYELTSKADIYSAYKGYKTFFEKG